MTDRTKAFKMLARASVPFGSKNSRIEIPLRLGDRETEDLAGIDATVVLEFDGIGHLAQFDCLLDGYDVKKWAEVHVAGVKCSCGATNHTPACAISRAARAAEVSAPKGGAS